MPKSRAGAEQVIRWIAADLAGEPRKVDVEIETS
jgi:hypothetical protein